ncbi:DUF2274 domain-containing protein [Sphingomonas sp. PL20]|uniref:DUF2274 domain-containing protein n=1 Tax=Sphingomonas sp. PL20 TaxID=2760712 RepID=UPI001AE52EB4
MTKLRLGRIEDEKPVKVTIELPGAVHRDLARYADAHARETGIERPLPVERLIPPMLERFMASDRAFARRRSPSAV